jgi:hypothetical protein
MLIIKVCVLWLYKNFSFAVLANQLQSLCYNLVMQVFMESLKRVLSFFDFANYSYSKVPLNSNYTIKLHWHRPVSYYSIPGLTGSTLNWMYFWHFLELSSYICILDLYMKWNVLIWKDTRKLVCSTFLYWILFFWVTYRYWLDHINNRSLFLNYVIIV